MKTLAIESSCDDTSLALVSYDDGYFSVDRIVVKSQTQIHAAYGGVVPELSYRAHAEHILPLVEELGGNDIADEIDAITVTGQPGLPGALLVGINVAHTLGTIRNKPVIEVNHIMGHVFSVLLERRISLDKVPYVCLTVSGGHSDIYIVRSRNDAQRMVIAQADDRIKRQHLGIGAVHAVGPFVVEKVAQTKDDAA